MRMPGTPPLPGFLSSKAGHRVLVAREDLLDRSIAAGLADAAVWEAALASGGPGRGAAGRLELFGGVRLVLKRMRRGGLAAAVWRDRFASAARLLRNLSVPVEAARRGVATAAPAALLVEEGPPGLYRAWLATLEIPGAKDLLSRLSCSPPPDEKEIAAVIRAVRHLHDAGVEHRDLNLGNLLLGPGGDGEPEAWVVDLDRAKLHPGPLPARKRRAALRRMERSYLKRFGEAGPLGGAPGARWRGIYAEGNEALAAALEAGRGVARASLALHRLGWRKRTR